MATAEEKRLDLYNGLQEVLGTERATTLMTYLPTEFNDFKVEVRAQFDKINDRLDSMNKRIDRVLLAVIGGLFVVVAAVVVF